MKLLKEKHRGGGIYLRICLGEQSRVVRAQSPQRELVGKNEEREAGAILQGAQSHPKHASETHPRRPWVFVLTVVELRKETYVCLA